MFTEVISYISYLLAGIGLTVLVVWPEKVPSAWVRNRLESYLPASVAEVFNCYVCFSFWAGLTLSLCWWDYWWGCLALPAFFWVLLYGRSKTDAT